MKLPILEKLKDGEKFDFATLAENYEQTQDYWAWWWETQASPDKITWPQIISDEDTILTRTADKEIANLCSYREFFNKTLFNMTKAGVIPIRDSMSREDFRKTITQISASAALILPEQPQLIITGGGYGSGKTTAINFLGEQGAIPVGLPNIVGADIFKQLIPEYNLITAIGDGRANMFAHDECIALSDNLVDWLIEHGRSFVWDSSMSNKNETMRRIGLAREHGYALTMVAVLTPVKIAMAQAIKRARDSRRFPPPDLVMKAHALFLQSFRHYVEQFDRVIVFARMDEISDSVLVAEKKTGETLEIFSPEIFNSPLFVPPTTA